MRRFLVMLFVTFALTAVGTVSLADGPRPDNCVRCGNEFKNVQPSSCGLLMQPVDAYRANGDFLATYDNRCFACTLNAQTFCTVDAATQAADLGETRLDELTVENGTSEAEAVFVDPCTPGQCRKDYRECTRFCSKNLCIIDCQTRFEICLEQCG